MYRNFGTDTVCMEKAPKCLIQIYIVIILAFLFCKHIGVCDRQVIQKSSARHHRALPNAIQICSRSLKSVFSCSLFAHSTTALLCACRFDSAYNSICCYFIVEYEFIHSRYRLICAMFLASNKCRRYFCFSEFFTT